MMGTVSERAIDASHERQLQRMQRDQETLAMRRRLDEQRLEKVRTSAMLLLIEGGICDGDLAEFELVDGVWRVRLDDGAIRLSFIYSASMPQGFFVLEDDDDCQHIRTAADLGDALVYVSRRLEKLTESGTL